MKFKRFLFIVFILIIAFSCYMYMNKYYDPLARYPYELTDYQHDLIVDNLDQQDIEYLIDYAIAPENFIDFVSYDDFNVYLVDEYDRMYSLYSGVESREMIMRLVNCTYDIYTEDEVRSLLDSYYFYEIVDYYEDGNTELLAPGVTELDFVIPADRSIGYYTPKDLTLINIPKLTDDTEMYLRTDAAAALDDLYAAVKSAFRGTYTTLRLSSAYISYDELNDLYQSTHDSLFVAGHSDLQLGLTIGFSADAAVEDILSWLQDNAHDYGFVADHNDENDVVYYRYVGVELAGSLYDSGLSLTEYANE